MKEGEMKHRTRLAEARSRETRLKNDAKKDTSKRHVNHYQERKPLHILQLLVLEARAACELNLKPKESSNNLDIHTQSARLNIEQIFEYTNQYARYFNEPFLNIQHGLHYQPD